MNIVEFAPAARAELDAAADRYELERPGRGQRFYTAVERAVKLIAAFPAAGPSCLRVAWLGAPQLAGDALIISAGGRGIGRDIAAASSGGEFQRKLRSVKCCPPVPCTSSIRAGRPSRTGAADRARRRAHGSG